MSQSISNVEVRLFPPLEAVVGAGGLRAEKLGPVVEKTQDGRIQVLERNILQLTDGDRMLAWASPPLAELYRGDRPSPPDMEMYPPAYMKSFHILETQLLQLCRIIGDRTDQEMEEVYTALRKRPAGRSLGPTHDYMWQASAFLLATHVLSQAEFEGMLDALIRSTRRWSLKPISRNYTAFLHKSFEH
jgi:hypothetical protein